MSDMFTLQTVPLTPNIGMSLKNFRIEHTVTAKSITEKFEKAPSYISKLEKGDIKKIESELLIQICNYITGSEDGLLGFLNRLVKNYRELDTESKIIVMNIEDLLLTHSIPETFVSDITKYMSEKNISIDDLVSTINKNEDIMGIERFDSLPENVWCSPSNDIDKTVIKLNIPLSYIDNLLHGKIYTIHRVIIEAILYSVYKLGNEKDHHEAIYNSLEIYHMLPTRKESRSIDDITKSLEPDTQDALKNVISGLKIITTVTKDYGSKRIKQISDNMKEDLSFSFAYMSADLVALETKDKTKKQQFLNELKNLIDKYSQDDTGIDIYE